MSLERTALRMATVMALANGFSAPWPTMAQNRVFDSRQDQITGLRPGDIVPIVIVSTDDDKGDETSGNNGGPPFVQHCHLVIDISIGCAVQYTPEGEDDPVIGLIPPQSEPELEAAIDLLEAQIKRVFRATSLAGTWGGQLQKTFLKVSDWQSHRFYERETNIRLVARQIRATVKLPLEADPVITQVANTPATIPGVLGPLLEAIIASNGTFTPTAQAIKNQILGNAPLPPIVLPELTTVRFVEANQATKNDAGVAAGPRATGVAQANLPAS